MGFCTLSENIIAGLKECIHVQIPGLFINLKNNKPCVITSLHSFYF